MRCLSLVLLVASPNALFAGFQVGADAYERGDYATSLQEFRMLAEQGNAAAQTILGDVYDNGERVVQDDTEPVRWHRMAAEQTYLVAQYHLGVMYRSCAGYEWLS